MSEPGKNWLNNVLKSAGAMLVAILGIAGSIKLISAEIKDQVNETIQRQQQVVMDSMVNKAVLDKITLMRSSKDGTFRKGFYLETNVPPEEAHIEIGKMYMFYKTSKLSIDKMNTVIKQNEGLNEDKKAFIVAIKQIHDYMWNEMEVYQTPYALPGSLRKMGNAPYGQFNGFVMPATYRPTKQDFILKSPYGVEHPVPKN